jgi:serine-type D-Ala-D-Ala carboxypeptidase/endopeptidase (penicillin-binding protein 4)
MPSKFLRYRWASLLLLGLGVASQAEPLPPPVVKALQQADIPQSAVGVYVRQLGSGKPEIAHRADQAMNPASVMKLVTTYAALEMLGPAYTWKTDVYATGLNGDAVSGNLYLQGHGDPALTLEDFWLMLRALRQRGVRMIKGDLVLDQRYFDLPKTDPNGFDNKGYRAYNTNPEATLISFKAVSARFIPSPDGTRLKIVLDPDLAPIKLQNQVNIKSGPCPNDWRDGISKDVQNDARSATIVLRGNFTAACGEKSLQFNLLSNTEFVAAIFRSLWTEMGGTWLGSIKDGQVSEGERPLLSWESEPLADAVRDTNKWSNNLMARTILLTLGAERFGAPGSTAKGERAIKSWLSQKNLDIPELVIENGAGLSRQERISAQSLGDLLANAGESPVMPELISSLPIAGADGTMKKRLKNNEITGRAHIKTGTLEGVKTIAGFVLSKSGKRLAVVFLVNHANAGEADVAQDALLQWVYQKY